MQQSMNDYPSIDKPWLKYYTKKDLGIQIPDMSLTEYIRTQNTNHLSLPALTYFGKTFSYQELFDNIDRASRLFQSLGVKENDYVALAMPLMPEVIFMMYGLDQIGAIANLIDPRIPADRMRFYINLAMVKICCVITSYTNTIIEAASNSTLEKIILVSPTACMSSAEQNRFLHKQFTAGERVGIYWKALKLHALTSKLNRHAEKHPVIYTYEKLITQIFPEMHTAAYRPGKASIVEYTSGTTGTPKGLELTASGMNVTAAQITQINRTTPGESLLGIMPPFISYGAVTGIHMSLSAGFNLILIPRFSVDIFAELIHKYKPNNIICVPSMFGNVIESPLLQHEDLSFLKRLIFGGDRTVPEFEERVNAWLDEHNAHIRLIKGGGMAEYSSCAFETPFEETKKPGAYGIPLPLVDAKIMKDDQTECGYDEIGEIYISSPQQMRGYIDNPGETEAFFFTDETGKKWGRSGDLGYVSRDGLFTLTSRKKQMIVRPDGHNVFPSEIENSILACNEVEECVTVGIKDDQSIVGEYPVAFIELKPDLTSSPNVVLKQIIKNVKKEIPVRDRPIRDEDYILTKIPYSNEGKIDRVKLISVYKEKKIAPRG